MPLPPRLVARVIFGGLAPEERGRVLGERLRLGGGGRDVQPLELDAHGKRLLELRREVAGLAASQNVIGVVVLGAAAALGARGVPAVAALLDVRRDASLRLAHAKARGGASLGEELLVALRVALGHDRAQRQVAGQKVGHALNLRRRRLRVRGAAHGERRRRGADFGALLLRRAALLRLLGEPFLDHRRVVQDGVLDEQQRREHARAHDGGGHGVPGEVGHLALALAREQQVVHGDALQRKRLDAHQRAAAVGHERHHGGREARADARRAAARGAVDVLRQVPHERLVRGVGVRLRQTQVVDVHQIQHAIRLRLAPVVPRVIRHRAPALPVGERAAGAQTLLDARALVARLAARPVRARARAVLARARQHLAPLVHARVV
mmetsp:Transcript_4136/g.16424  ORF Transcript_4136/g.16424 Transcript_4136/m.16424 type:complete len:380 (+) Transcript_4136:2472-3611(+)